MDVHGVLCLKGYYLGYVRKSWYENVRIGLVCWYCEKIFAGLEGVEEGVYLVGDGILLAGIIDGHLVGMGKSSFFTLVR